ncbi:retropepsin-like aspartic protease family protein [Stappia sp.]|uniref:retropepsin-like aspartic protease family protein n=1 Tax=Stappia sp. TaxID=1870903 RepID=UPI003A99C1F3
MLRYLLIAGVVVIAAALAPRFAPDLMRQLLNADQTAAEARSGDPAAPKAVQRGPRTLVLSVSRNGHYEVDAYFNGRPVHSLIDTGASVVALPADVARASGLNPSRADYTARVSTANGTVLAAPVTLREMRLGSIRLVNVKALVLPEGALQVPLIGMSALNRLSKVDIRSGTMRLIQ